jgi:hypothetical protein
MDIITTTSAGSKPNTNGTAYEADQLIAAGLALCKPDPGTKNPSYPGWPTRSLAPEDFAPGDLLGILGGPLSDCNLPGHALAVVDADSAEAVRKASNHLPATAMMDGRASKPLSHRYFAVPLNSIPEWAWSQAEQGAAAALKAKGHPGPFLKRFRHAETGEAVLDFIGTGGLVVAPPSKHPLGEVRTWAGGTPGKPAVVPFLQLWDAACELVLACGGALPFARDDPPAAGTFRHNGHADLADLITRRVLPYLEKVDPAVSGKGGHDGTFWPARVVCWGFDLGCERGFEILRDHFNPRCQPAWSEAELRHKCHDADTLPFGKPRGWLLEAAGRQPRTGSQDDRPAILVSTERKHVNDQAVAALALAVKAGRCDLYYRGGLLVRVVHDCASTKRLRRREEGARIAVVAPATLGEEMAASALWEKWHASGKGKLEIVPAHPPNWSINGVHERGVWPGIDYLAGVAESPTLRADGTILDRPGYDPGTGLIYEPVAQYPAVPEKPTQEDAKTAAKDLLALVDEFPFATDDHKAVWLAAVLTVLARPAIAGPCPLFLFEAPAAGSGKTLLAELVGLVATGREVAVSEVLPRPGAHAGQTRRPMGPAHLRWLASSRRRCHGSVSAPQAISLSGTGGPACDTVQSHRTPNISPAWGSIRGSHVLAGQAERLVLGQDQDVKFPAVEAVGEGEIDDPVHSAERDGRFGPLAGERVQPCASTAGEQHGQHFAHNDSLLEIDAPGGGPGAGFPGPASGQQFLDRAPGRP